ncbi:hypothetical protein GCM10010341_76170 [Streptomyces noursei]|nr:hypothetical protein GCM10010341_76170 [Streptomyces noursei]
MRGGVVAGVEGDEDVAVAGVPAAHLDQVRDHAAELGGGDLGDVVLGAETDGVQELAPGSAARFEGGDEGVRPAGDHLVRGAAAAAVDVAEQTVRAGRRVGAEPVADIDHQDQSPVGGPRHRQMGQHLPQPGHVHTPAVQRLVHRAVPAPVLGHQREVHRRGHQTVRAQQRVDEFGQFVHARGQTVE